jgi:hypothetical protein
MMNPSPLILVEEISMTAIYTQVFVGGLTALVCSAFGCYVGIKVALTEIRGELKLRGLEITTVANQLDEAQREFKDTRKAQDDRIRMIEERLYTLRSHYEPERK